MILRWHYTRTPTAKGYHITVLHHVYNYLIKDIILKYIYVFLVKQFISGLFYTSYIKQILDNKQYFVKNR